MADQPRDLSLDSPPVSETSSFTRRRFLKTAAVSAATVAGFKAMGCQDVEDGHGKGEVLAVDPARLTPQKASKLVKSACPYCGVGCGTLIRVEDDKIVGMVPDKDHPTNKGLQCIKGLTANEPIYIDRLTTVLVRKDMSDPITGYVSKTKGRFDDDVWQEMHYDEASVLVADRIAKLHRHFGGNSISLYGSGQLTVEGQYLENKFIKGLLQSNSIEANARMCMTSAVTGYIHSFGSDAPAGSYDDIELCDMILHFGHNCRESHPIVYWRCAEHKRKNDVPTVVVDPRETGTFLGYQDLNASNTHHLSTINGDISILNAMAHVILEEHPDIVDFEFLKTYTEGWEDYVEGVKTKYRPEDIEAITLVPAAKIREIAGLYAAATRKGKERGTGGVLTFWGIGYNQHIHGQHNVISIINLHLLTGNIGRPGCGPFSMTGQPNAMGERFTGGLTGRLPFNEGLDNEAHRRRTSEAWGFAPDRLDPVVNAANPGFAVGLMERSLKKDLHAMFLIYATHIDLPDTHNLVRPALERMFCVVQDIYRHAPNLLYADVVFPAATWGECGGTYMQSERRFYVTDKAANPPFMTLNGAPMKDKAGQPMRCPTDLDMVVDKGKHIADLLGLEGEKLFPYKKLDDGRYDPEDIFREIIRASKGSDADLTGMLEVEERKGIAPYEQLRTLRGIQWPCPTMEQALSGGSARRYMDQEGWKDKPYGTFRRRTGKAKFKLCQQIYEGKEALHAEAAKAGVDPTWFAIDHLELITTMRDHGLTPEWPDKDWQHKPWDQVPKDKFPYWMGLGVVYEHFHTAKTVRAATTRKLVPEMYIEMHPVDAAALGFEDGEWIRVVTRRGSLEARVQLGRDSLIKPARNSVPQGYAFSPWNLSVADSADPRKNKWLANAISHRIFDPVSGQVDFKKLAARFEKISVS